MMKNIDTTYQATLDFLYSQLPMYQRVGAKAFKKNLDNIIALTDALDQPQHDFPSIHIAGTNGKGSTTHLIGAVLQAKGLKVGLYTSPHYRDFRERIKINGIYIPKEDVIEFVENYKHLFDEIQPSYFEITVAMAFWYFQKEAVDIAIIETGLGGRLDSTNIITPLLSVITNISFDHTDMLGDTLPLIAGEKAGIIKSNTPVVIGEYHNETAPVFIKKAATVNAPIFFAKDALAVKMMSSTLLKTTYTITDVKTDTILFDNLVSDLWGNYQLKNIRTALHALHILNQTHNYQITFTNIKEGFANTKQLTNMIGRWEILSQQPLILADSGHNEAGIRLIQEQLKTVNFEHLHFVIGMVKDKDPSKALSLLPKNATYYFAKPAIIRGMNANTLKAHANEFQLQGEVYESVTTALEAAKKAANENDLIFVGGSTFVVAEVV